MPGRWQGRSSPLHRTGMKCLSRDKIRLANGITLHDWHAEVLALRAFNRFLIDECSNVVEGNPSPWIRHSSRPEQVPFTLKEDVRICMCCSEAPCGDASMELVMSEQEDATPWECPPLAATKETADSTAIPLRGRGYFSELGIVRTKPCSSCDCLFLESRSRILARPDAAATLSKSCTDKLALKQCTSLLSSMTSTLISPDRAYLDTLVLPESQCVPAAFERSFGPNGRMTLLPPNVTETWAEGYAYRPFKIATTCREFTYSKRKVSGDNDPIASNISTVWTQHFREVLIGGIQQGRKQFDASGASMTCRKRMWEATIKVSRSIEPAAFDEGTKQLNYADVKASDVLAGRCKVKDDVRKHALAGWVRNTGDDSFEL